jgi:hypothetical protein
MTDKHASLSMRLERLGFTKGNQVRLYGLTYELIGRPLIVSDHVVLVDATEQKSRMSRRLRIPPAIVNMAREP